MRKKILLISLYSLLAISCKLETRFQKRHRLIKEFIIAVNNFDTNRIFNIVDTAEDFKGHSKESFLDVLAFMHSHFSNAELDTIDQITKVQDVPGHAKEYLIQFRRGPNGIISDSSFDISFTFYDYTNDNKIEEVALKKYFFNIIPTIPPPIQKN